MTLEIPVAIVVVALALVGALSLVAFVVVALLFRRYGGEDDDVSAGDVELADTIQIIADDWSLLTVDQRRQLRAIALGADLDD